MEHPMSDKKIPNHLTDALFGCTVDMLHKKNEIALSSADDKEIVFSAVLRCPFL